LTQLAGRQDDALRALIVAGAREFNAGRYFEAHEALEEGLDQVPEELWELFLGLIQIAVGYHKVTQQLWPGAARMLELGLAKLESFPDDAAAVDLRALRARARADLQAIREQRYQTVNLASSRPRLRPLAI
jgi:hypothetical protein